MEQGVIEDWVKEAREGKLTEEEIRQILKQKGYPDNFVENMLMKVDIKPKRNPLLLILLALLGIIVLFGLIVYLLYTIVGS